VTPIYRGKCSPSVNVEGTTRRGSYEALASRWMAGSSLSSRKVFHVSGQNRFHNEAIIGRYSSSLWYSLPVRLSPRCQNRCVQCDASIAHGWRGLYGKLVATRLCRRTTVQQCFFWGLFSFCASWNGSTDIDAAIGNGKQ